jgi:hypothetical protein
MSTGTGTSLKRSAATAPATAELAKGKPATQTAAKKETAAEDARFANIQANVFYKVMFDQETKPEEKRAQIAKILAYEGTKEENRDKIKAFELFKEYLQAQREAMAQEIIRLTDTETFAELKEVYDQLNGALIDFDNKMKPLTDIIDAVYTLRTNGLTIEAFQEIIRDRRQEADLAKQRDDKKKQFEVLRNEVDQLNGDIAALGERRALFGLLGPNQETREEIARKQLRLATISDNLGALNSEISALDKQVPSESALGEFAEQKKKLRELLDISTDEHKQRQRELVDSAISFVNTAKTRVGAVRQHLTLMNDQVENLFDANNMMGTVYAIMNESIKDAGVENQKLRDSLEAPASSEDMITKMSREQKKMAVEQHMTMLDASATDTMATYSDLVSGAIRIKTMKDAVDQQAIRARTMHSQGISGVADRLSVVLQAVSSAALGEASAMAKDTLQQMAENTNKVAQKESIRIAMGVQEQNADLTKAIDDLGSYGEVVRAATNITREGLTEMRGKLAELKTLAESVQGDIHEAIAVNADTRDAGPAKTPAAQQSTGAQPAAGPVPNPFKLGGN